MSTRANVLIKTDASTLVADMLAAAFIEPIKQEEIEFGRKIWVNNSFWMAVVAADYDDDGEKRFSLYKTSVIIASYSKDQRKHHEECLSIGREVMKTVISKMRVACLLVSEMQEVIESYQPE